MPDLAITTLYVLLGLALLALGVSKLAYVIGNALDYRLPLNTWRVVVVGVMCLHGLAALLLPPLVALAQWLAATQAHALFGAWLLEQIKSHGVAMLAGALAFSGGYLLFLKFKDWRSRRHFASGNDDEVIQGS